MMNQFRSAELRGAGVILRLGRLADTSELRGNFTAHLRDEGNHAWLWTKTIQDLGGEIEDVPDPYQARLGTLFGVPRSVEDLLALTLVSERRGVETYAEQADRADALPESVHRVLRAILKDERWHVSWIEEELRRRAATSAEVALAIGKAESADRQAMTEMRDLADAQRIGHG
jgi:bacterioferritin (cytochrome b1)